MPAVVVGLDELVARARRLAGAGGRRLLGITGPPGAGKSTLAAALADALGPGLAVVVGMDGFHLADAELVRLGRRDRKGAPDTFDAHGYLALLQRLRAAEEPVTYAPLFRREIEDSIAAAVPVPSGLPLIITEGNYLLLASDPWCRLRAVLDEVWYVDPPDEIRLSWLVERHASHGKNRQEARAWALGPDQRNAELIATHKHRADLLIRPSDRIAL
jgi:pantothenate kinase